MTQLKPISLSGDPYSIGYCHGLSEGSVIRSFLADDFSHINANRTKKLPWEKILDRVQEHKWIIEQDVPLLAKELRGLADGAGISYDEAILLQMRREIVGKSSLASGECSLIAKLEQQEAVIAQTVDQNPVMAALGRIFRICSSDQNIPEILMFSFSGLLGFLGMNSAGLGIGINFVSSDDWKPGVSPYLLIRHLLQLRSLEECLQALRQIRRSSSRSFTICDRSHLAIVEMTSDNLRVTRGSKLVRTNHFLHADFINLDSMNIFSRNASKLRLERLRELVSAQNWETDPERLFEIFSDHSLYPVGLCAHSEGNARREDTVAAVILDLHNQTISIRVGHPCKNPTQNFSLGVVQ